MENKAQKSSTQYTNLVAGFLILIFMISGIVTLPKYGMSWDEGLGNFFFGERYLHYLTSFQEKYLDFKADLPLHSAHPLNLFPSTWRNSPEIFPAMADIPSAASMYLFSYILGWMDPVDGFHLFSILLLTVFLWILFQFSSKRIGKTAALFAIIFLATFPRLWGDMHFNQKDIPEMVFIGMSMMAYWRWTEKPSWKWAVLTGVLGGAAVGVKANALFLPIMMILGAWPFRLGQVWNHLKRYFLHYIIMIFSAAGLYYLSWPYIYSNPSNALKYFAAISTQGGRVGSTTWNWQPLEITSATMPEVMLFFLVLGLILIGLQILQKKDGFPRYIFIWCLFPILRISIPPSVNFDGIRHFLEFLPAAALIAGVGTSRVLEWIAQRKKLLRYPSMVIIILAVSFSTILNFKNFGDYQYIYFNSLSGGLPGGARLFGAAESTDYWAVSYRQGIQWLNENAPKDAVVHVPVGGHLVDLTGPLWLRSDIQVIGEELLTQQKEAGHAVYIMMVTRSDFYNSVAETCIIDRTLEYQILVEGIPILHICRW